MTVIPPSQLVTTALAAARSGAAVLDRFFRNADLRVRFKGEHDLVTEADRESETAVVETIRAAYPKHHVLAEEGGLSATGTSEYRWLIDPLDGTTNFAHGLPAFAVSVACQHHGETVAAAILEPRAGNAFTAALGGGAFWNDEPMQVSSRTGLEQGFMATGFPWRSRAALDVYLRLFRDVFLQARGIRRCGAAALDLAYTAAGAFDGFFEFNLAPWDFAAGELLIREAGGRVTNLDGGADFYHQGNIVAGNPTFHTALLAVVQRHVSEARLAALAAADGAPPSQLV